MPEPLTSIEHEILEYLIEYLRRNTYQPSIREIGRHFDIKSTKTVSEHLQSLADKGWVERDPSRSRGVRLLGLDLGADTSSVPCYDELTADGTPVTPDSPLEVIGLDRRLAGSPDSFFFTMQGDSMSAAGIHPGDLLLVVPTQETELTDGDTVVVSLSGECTVKRYIRRAGAIVLEPANPDYPPTLVRDDTDFVLVGRVSAVFRRMRVALPAATTALLEGKGGEPVG